MSLQLRCGDGWLLCSALFVNQLDNRVVNPNSEHRCIVINGAKQLPYRGKYIVAGYKCCNYYATVHKPAGVYVDVGEK